MADPNEVLSSTEEKTNFQRLTRLLISGGSSLLRETFDKYCPQSTLPRKLSDPFTKSELINGKITNPEWNKLYPSPGVYGTSKDFDITLIFRLLRTSAICGLTPPRTGWNFPPANTDHSLTADLVRIKNCRNTLFAHGNGTMDIENDKFRSIWNEIKDALIRIAGKLSRPKEEEWKASIHELLTSPLTADDKRHVEELEKWYIQDKEVKESLVELKVSVENVEKSIEKINSSVENVGRLVQEGVQEIKRLEEQVQEKVRLTATSAATEAGRATHLQLQIDIEASPETSLKSGASGMVVSQQDVQGMACDTVRDVAAYSVRGAANVSNSDSLFQDFMAEVGKRYLRTIEPSTPEEFGSFLQYLHDVRNVVVRDCRFGSLILTVECNSLEILEKLWEDYCSGHLGEMAQKCLVSDDILNILGLTEVKVKTFIDEEEYIACRQHFLNYYQDATSTTDIGEPAYKRRKSDTSEDQSNDKSGLLSELPTGRPFVAGNSTETSE